MSTVEFDNLKIMRELGDILRGEHKRYKGDRRVNAGHFLHIVRTSSPRQALALADDLRDNHDSYCEQTGISPRSVTMAELVLRGKLLGM